jgi:hypothetical protein
MVGWRSIFAEINTFCKQVTLVYSVVRSRVAACSKVGLFLVALWSTDTGMVGERADCELPYSAVRSRVVA